MAESYTKWVENTVGKREIARNERSLLFPQCFQKACFQGASKGVIVWEWVEKKEAFVNRLAKVKMMSHCLGHNCFSHITQFHNNILHNY